METEEELEDWLKMLLTLQHGEDVPDGEQPKPTFGQFIFYQIFILIQNGADAYRLPIFKGISYEF